MRRKIGPQRVGPFPIKRKVGHLAYELTLPSDMRIHPVISIAQLERIEKTNQCDASKPVFGVVELFKKVESRTGTDCS